MKKPPVDQITGREFLSGLFSLVMGAADFVEEIEKGTDPLLAVKRAAKKTKRRRVALRRAELEVVQESESSQNEDAKEASK